MYITYQKKNSFNNYLKLRLFGVDPYTAKNGDYFTSEEKKLLERIVSECKMYRENNGGKIHPETICRIANVYFSNYKQETEEEEITKYEEDIENKIDFWLYE